MAVGCVALATMAVLAQNPKREMRSSWIAAMGIDWPKGGTPAAQKSSLTTMLNNLQAMGLNNVCLHVRPRADAFYKSTLEPWSGDLTGTRGQDPGWDPLAWAVEECHKRGMEIYAWVNPFRVNANNVTYTTAFDKQWEANGWLFRSGKWTSFNPAIPGARQHCLDVLKEIYTNYDIDGMLFDDYFYPGDKVSQDSSAPDWKDYKASGTTMTIGDWRRENVLIFLRALYADIQKTRPDMRYGIGPAGVGGGSAYKYGLSRPPVSSGDWMYDGIYCDPLAWMDEDVVDFNAPQIYWSQNHSTAPFEPLVKWWSQVSEHFGKVHAWTSIADYKYNNLSEYPTEIEEQIMLTRKYAYPDNAPGTIHYNTTAINGTSLGKHLQATVYSTPALTPELTWKSHPSYDAVTGATVRGTALSWNAATPKLSTIRPILRYTVYAVPKAYTYEDALAKDGDGIDGQYLLGVTYTNSYTIPSDKANGYWYAVCVFDGYCTEHTPAIIGYDAKPSEATTLVSPADGSNVEWNVEFKWTAVTDAIYHLQVASDANFANLLVDRANLTATDATADVSSARSNATLYWRVGTIQPDRTRTWSQPWTIVVPKHDFNEEGYYIKKDPAAYDNNGSLQIENLWIRSTVAPYSNMNFELDGSLNRGMAAEKDYVYLSGRVSNSSASETFLAKYDARTGEHLEDITLDQAGSIGYYPCNDVISDGFGHLVITNLTTSISGTPLKLFMVDTKDNPGALTLIAQPSYAERVRVDHAGVYGDVTSGNFTIFAAVASKNRILRWKVNNGTVGAAEVLTVSSFFPANLSNFGVAPRVRPVDHNILYVDGGSTAWSLYDFESGALLGTFADAPECAPAYNGENGGDIFTLGTNNYAVYNSNCADAGSSQFNIVRMASPRSFKGMTNLWTVPRGGLGNVNSQNCSAPCAAVVTAPGEANVFVYTSGNGLAAYKVSDTSLGVTDITAGTDKAFGYRIEGHSVILADGFANATAYTASGALAAVTTDGILPLPGPGLYIIASGTARAKVVVR